MAECSKLELITLIFLKDYMVIAFGCPCLTLIHSIVYVKF